VRRSVRFSSAALIERLADGGRRVSDLTASAGLSQSNLSKHLPACGTAGRSSASGAGARSTTGSWTGLGDLLHAADRVLERTGDRVQACPRYGRLADRRAA
jgi:DNA-binding transcriptional ArsR family regulator